MDTSQLQWQTIADALSDSIFMVRDDGAIFYVNDFACEKLGYTREQLMSMDVMSLGSKYTSQNWEEMWGRFASERVVRFESNHRHVDGQEYPVLVTVNYVDGALGSPFVIAHVQDLTESVFTRKRLQLAVESAELGFWELDLSNGKVYVSPELQRQLGQAEDFKWDVDVWKSLLHPDDLNAAIEHLETFQNGKSSKYLNRFRLRHVDGSYRWIESRGSYVTNERGEILRFMGTHLDITEQKRVEDRLRDTLAESESVKRSLRRSNEDLEQFAYIASHDLRAPLRGLLHLTEWVKEDAVDEGVELPESTSVHLGKMKAQVDRMDSMLRGLLEYSRVGQRQQMEREVSLNDVLQDAIKMATPPEGFQILTPEQSPEWVTVAEVLQRIFQNLIDNAIKHHDRSTGTIEVKCDETPDAYVFSVIDDGPGIEERFHSKVFEIFQTLKKQKDETVTSGLGLSIVNKLVKTVGGSIEIRAVQPRGSEFRFTWPKQLDFSN